MHSVQILLHSDTPALGAALESDKIAALEWLGDAPCRTLLGRNWTLWTQARGWTRGYRNGIAELIRQELVLTCQETASQTRARIVTKADQLCEDAHANGEYAAAVGALRLQADYLLPKAPEHHLHVHAQASDLRALSDAELSRLASAEPDDVAPASDDMTPGGGSHTREAGRE